MKNAILSIIWIVVIIGIIIAEISLIAKVDDRYTAQIGPHEIASVSIGSIVTVDGSMTFRSGAFFGLQNLASEERIFSDTILPQTGETDPYFLITNPSEGQYRVILAVADIYSETPHTITVEKSPTDITESIALYLCLGLLVFIIVSFVVNNLLD